MKQNLFLVALLAVLSLSATAAPRTETVSSPNGEIRLVVTVGDQLQYSVYYGDDWMNVATDDDEIRFDVTYNELGPMKNQLQEAVDNWVYMKESHGHKVDQKLMKDDYALVRSIETDEDDGTQTVVVWFVMVTKEPEGFSGSIQSSMGRANEAIDILVEMLGTLSQK